MNETADKTELRTVDDFIAFFSAIPDDKWKTGHYGIDGGKRCALGHLGIFSRGAVRFNLMLNDAFGTWTDLVNDGDCKAFPQPTPKARILAALHEIKSHQEKES